MGTAGATLARAAVFGFCHRGLISEFTAAHGARIARGVFEKSPRHKLPDKLLDDYWTEFLIIISYFRLFITEHYY